ARSIPVLYRRGGHPGASTAALSRCDGRLPQWRDVVCCCRCGAVRGSTFLAASHAGETGMNISVPKKVLLGLCAAALFQVLVLGGELLAAVYPRWTGVPIRVAVEPVDPRDLFRGNYARLGYAFSRVDAALWQDAERPVPGQRVYVQIEQNDAGAWEATSMSATPPSQGLFLRGRYRHFISGANLNADGAAWQTQPDRYRIEYGIE